MWDLSGQVHSNYGVAKCPFLPCSEWMSELPGQVLSSDGIACPHLPCSECTRDFPSNDGLACPLLPCSKWMRASSGQVPSNDDIASSIFPAVNGRRIYLGKFPAMMT